VSAPGDPKQENDGGVAQSEPLTLLPSQVTSAALPLSMVSASAVPGPSVAGASQLSDASLIEAIQRGDAKVGALLYSRLVRVIDATVSRVLGPGEPDHDDWVQAAFEEVLRTIYQGKFKGRCKLTSWAASVSCNICLNAIRRRKTERGLFDRDKDADDVPASNSPSHPERALEARDELRQLREALATLSPARAEAVLLHDAFGYDLSEVAALTGSSEAAVQSRLSRGRRDLQERLGLADEARGEST